MQIHLGTYTFELASGTFVTKQPLIEYPQHLRTTGQQERGGQTLMSNWWLENFESGFGCLRIDLASDRMKTSFWDSKADTIYRGQVTNPRAPREITGPQPHAVYTSDDMICGLSYDFGTKTAANFQSFLVTKDAGVIRGDALYLSQYTGTSWGSPKSFGTANFYAKNIDYVGGYPAVCYWASYTGGTRGTLRLSRLQGSTTAVFWNYNVEGMMPNLLQWKWMNTAESIVVNYRTASAMRAYSTNAYVPFGFIGIEGTTTRSALMNFTSFQGQDGYEGLFVFYRNKMTCWENYFMVSAGTLSYVDSSEIPYLNLVGLDDDNNMNDVVVYNGALVFPVQDTLLAYAADGSVMDIGMDLFHGMPPDKQGKIVALCSSVRYLYAALNQKGPRQVFQFDGVGWHWFGETPSLPSGSLNYTRLFRIINPNGVPQLMLSVEGATAGYVWDYPDANPVWLPVGATIAWVPTSYLVTPEFDGGLPNQKGVAYKLSVEGVFDATRRAAVYYSTLGNATNWTLLGTASSPGKTTFDFGTLGVPHDLIQFKFDLAGNATGTPVLRTAVLDYLKFPDVRDVYTFTIDLVKTNNGNLASVQTHLDILASMRDSYPMIPFKYGSSGTVNVKILEMPAQESHVTTADNVYGTTGMAALITLRAVKLL